MGMWILTPEGVTNVEEMSIEEMMSIELAIREEYPEK